ncbi:vanadium-dependent haloperoxidase [Vibrio alginolyticus]|uniref:vanadium-dependent haloperoxidase n=1 Tax=Vibrio sp. B1FLJ16 TaxID=2751178 RepID=UPI0015F6A827|nr:vanadium-dependent haloperoxidase [Vibrio sp. B1FLJ16]CAD7809542.1 PA-phosphatase related [Vibrio sp. B1FLJ16]CAD7810294.1 PA-phosphatase related [Vibrio sp. B1FLJ16]CAE6909857.1 PA-phosphatase related [Vibrio sp. B1FLJ16]CAE6913102.1 PA-phosphatase related [Vibrio sp. B1FLJ16]
MTDYRKDEAKRVRDAASQMAYDREHPNHQSNGDEQRFASANYAMSFTKGLEHDEDTGLIVNAGDFRAFRSAIDHGKVDAFTTSVPSAVQKQRQWEAPTAGLVCDLQGPDSHSVTMAPAPVLGSKELAYEMAEVYELALLRDVPLTEFKGSSNGNLTGSMLEQSIYRLNKIEYDISGREGRSRKNNDGDIIGQTAFRGSSPGVDIGPYLSQFMLLGTKSVAGDGDITDGIIGYGALSINQKVPVALAGVNFMTTDASWLAVQNGADTQSGSEVDLYGSPPVARRFISTPRDLATYVHYDALYEAYLNACLILLGMKVPTDPGFDSLSGRGQLSLNSFAPDDPVITRFWETHEREAGGFALWGGPHILTLVTEVATRALKAVRYQKFNTHCRLRPEALAARIHKATQIETNFPSVEGFFTGLRGDILDTVAAIEDLNSSGTSLLPMAFQEGSPMHPSYGAGHATVAGACVTILKAYFDTNCALLERSGNVMFSVPQAGDTPVAYVSNYDDSDATKVGDSLVKEQPDHFLTVEGELNKLAANISIGRNMAGVHYYSDYYDSLRMGEKIALGILEEQALCYTQEPFVLSVPTFDGEVRRIGAP